MSRSPLYQIRSESIAPLTDSQGRGRGGHVALDLSMLGFQREWGETKVIRQKKRRGGSLVPHCVTGGRWTSHVRALCAVHLYALQNQSIGKASRLGVRWRRPSASEPRLVQSIAFRQQLAFPLPTTCRSRSRRGRTVLAGAALTLLRYLPLAAHGELLSANCCTDRTRPETFPLGVCMSDIHTSSPSLVY